MRPRDTVPPDEVVEARRFVLKDRQGRVRAESL
jgi:hypothetical protein